MCASGDTFLNRTKYWHPLNRRSTLYKSRGKSAANESDWFKVWCASNILKVKEICRRSEHGTVEHGKVTTSLRISSVRIFFTAEAETLYVTFSAYLAISQFSGIYGILSRRLTMKLLQELLSLLFLEGSLVVPFWESNLVKCIVDLIPFSCLNNWF